MFRMFQKKKTAPVKHRPQMDKAAATIAKGIIRLQTRIANWLSKQEQTLTIKQKKYALLVFCVSMSIITGSLLYRGLFDNHHNQNPDWLQTPGITIPKTHPLPDSLDLNMLQELESKKTHEKTDTIHP